MNPKLIEESDARQVIGKAQELILTGIAGGKRESVDREAATLALLLSATQIYTKSLGLRWDVLINEVSYD